jgi:hypothetical protein
MEIALTLQSTVVTIILARMTSARVESALIFESFAMTEVYAPTIFA